VGWEEVWVAEGDGAACEKEEDEKLHVVNVEGEVGISQLVDWRLGVVVLCRERLVFN
jgi:hypothetical protein